MKKLNNKGITIVEVLVCFILVSVIAMSLFSTISAYNQMRMLEEYKYKIYSYKNVLTKEIQDDFIKRGLASAVYKRTATSEGRVTHVVDFVLKDGEKRQLVVIREPNNDYYMIMYGTDENNLVEYPIPDLGKSEINGKTVSDLTINNVLISVTTKDDSSVLSIYIGFYHPELSTRYAINIICPIDYSSTSSDGTNMFSFS